MPLVVSGPVRGATVRDRVAARSRRDLLRQIRAVAAVAPLLAGDRVVTVSIECPPLGSDEVESAFDEIHEKLHLSGIGFRLDEREGAPLRVALELRARSGSPRRAVAAGNLGPSA